MKLLFLSIHNFRGVRSGDFVFPPEQSLVCIIGSGDSCKTTLLKAIEWCLWPSWKLNVSDSDFYNGDLSAKIIIEATLTDISKELLTEDRFGLYLRDGDSVIDNSENDDPTDNGTIAVTIRLEIDDSLEPEWSLIKNGKEPRRISQKDRSLLSFGVVGSEYEKDFFWGRTSVLHKMALTAKGKLNNIWTQIMCSAIKTINLDDLDEEVGDINGIGGTYGVSFNGVIHNQLMLQNGSHLTTVGLFDDRVPFSQRGLGSKRLMSMGMNIHASKEGSLILIDEIETGLEPYRICALINQLRTDFSTKGQLFFTTHSRSAVCECNANELFVLNENKGVVSLHHLADHDPDGNIQSLIRTSPDSFLCKRIIVCEGKTEVGLLRALDDCVNKKEHTRFAHYGVGVITGEGGSRCLKLAKLLQKCGYDVCVLMDSDDSSLEKQKGECRDLGIEVFSWENGNAVEDQIFRDVDTETAQKLIQLVCEIKSSDHIYKKLSEIFKDSNDIFSKNGDAVCLGCNCSPDDMRKIGVLAKSKGCEWFKQIDIGQRLGEIVFEDYDKMDEQKKFKIVIEGLKKWIKKDET